MKLYKNTRGVWAVRFKDSRGNEHSRSLKTKNKVDAEKLVKEAGIAEIERAGQVATLTRDIVSKITAGKRVLIEDANNEWGEHRRLYSKSENTIYTTDKIIDQFILDAKVEYLDDVSEDMVYNYINGDNGKSKGSKEQEISTLRGLFDFVTKRGYVITDPTLLVKVNAGKLTHKQKEPKKKKPFTEDEFSLILLFANDFLKIASAISWYTGLRLGDICRLEWDSIGKDSITVWTAKRDKRVEVPYSHPLIGEGALKVFLKGIEKTDERYCFPKEKICIEHPTRRSNYSVQFGKLMKKIGVEGKSFHSLRHSFVTRLKKAGMELEDIGKLVGHSDTKTTEIYSHG